MQPAVYTTQVEDFLITSNSNGSARDIVITPKKLWGLGLNLESFLAGLRIVKGDTNFGVKVIWQYSLDNVNWKDGASDIISEKTTADDYTGTMSTASEMTPYVRLAVSIRDTTAATQVTAVISVWGYYKYRT